MESVTKHCVEECRSVWLAHDCWHKARPSHQLPGNHVIPRPLGTTGKHDGGSQRHVCTAILSFLLPLSSMAWTVYVTYLSSSALWVQ